MDTEVARICPDRVLSLEARRRWAQAGESEAGPVRLPDAAVSSVSRQVLHVSLLRAPGRVFRFLAADAARQLRAAGDIVIEPGMGPFSAEDADIGHRLRNDAVDVVLQIGSRVPAALRLAAQLRAPLLRLDTPWPLAVAEVVREALAGEAASQPLLEITLDGTSMITLGPVHVVEGSSQPRHHGEEDTPRSLVGIRIQPAGSAMGLDLWRDGHHESSDGGVEISGHRRVRLLVDGVEHVGGHAVVRPCPVKLRLLVSERRH